MRKLLLSIIASFTCILTISQIPPAIQWQKCIGGTDNDISSDVEPTPDGGFIIAGFTASDNGDITGNHGFGDALIIKTDAAGNIQWRKCYGGSGNDAALKIKPAADGGYIFTGTTLSNDGDVSGFHGGGLQDIWVVKIDGIGSLQWQRCLGGTDLDIGYNVDQTSDGGYIISGSSRSINGDLPGPYLGLGECWIIKLDGSGNLQWQRRYGGTKTDGLAIAIQTSDGGYIFGASSSSGDGDVSCNNPLNSIVWIAKIDNTGNIQWQQCSSSASGINSLLQTADGGYIIAGSGNGGLGDRDAWILKIDAAGSMQWEKFLGGTGWDESISIKQTSDGGYIVAGSSNSPEVDVCNIKGAEDLWILKLSSLGIKEWQKRFGGTLSERPAGYVAPVRIVPTPGGGYMVAGSATSNDGDISGNHGNADIWLIKFSFPGVPVLPSVNITANETVICPGGNVSFSSAITIGGGRPSYQWQLNGSNIAGSNSNTIDINILHDGDSVNCILTSNSACVTTPTAVSNTIVLHVDGSLTPAGFLPASAEICTYEPLKLGPAASFSSYLWNTNDTIPILTVTDPGTYWLQVTTDKECIGSDTILVVPKDCLKGFYMPTAFTPNQDGKNDILKPILGGNVKKYMLSVYNRWGQLIFQTTDPAKGWDGNVMDKVQDNNVFVWVCIYRFEGEDIKTARGTVMLIK